MTDLHLTREQVELFDLPQVERYLKLIEKQYKLDRPIQEYLTAELWDELDQIINSLALLEDRRDWIKQYGHLSNARDTMLLNKRQEQ